MTNLVDSLNKFSFETLQRTNTSDDKQNIVYSPYSAFVCVAMSTSLFTDETRNEIITSLQIQNQDNDVNLLFKKLKELISSENSNKAVSISNNIWANQRFEFKPSTFEPNQKILGIPIEKVGFPQPACEKINSEVYKSTKGKISNLISPSDLSEDSAIVLTNAIYFKSDWEKKFSISPDSKIQKIQNFTLVDGTKIHINMLESKDRNLPYAEDDKFQIVSIPYTGKKYDFVIILPKNQSHEGYNDLKNLTYQRLNDELISKLRVQKVNVRLPKFSFETKSQLKGIFQELGMKKAFQGDAQCTDPVVKYFVDSIFQKAKIILDENGTEAAAATAMVVNCLSLDMGPPTPSINANHPFAYLLRNSKSGAILFEGFVKDPSE